MKKSFVPILISITFLFLSCNLGLIDGADLEGTWYAKNSYGVLCWTFNDNGTGEHTTVYFIKDSFQWDVDPTLVYNVVIIDWDDGDPDSKYEYYFNLDKTRLYLKNKNDPDDFWTEYTQEGTSLLSDIFN